MKAIKVRCNKTKKIHYCKLDPNDEKKEWCLIWEEGKEILTGRIHKNHLKNKYKRIKND
jgi:hypothetical protein